MIFVDANVFLRYLIQPVTPPDRINAHRAAVLFALVDAGAAEITTSDAILAEVAFILTSPRHYAASRSMAATGLKTLLRSQGRRMPEKDVSLRALDLWVGHPVLSYPDALAAAYSALHGDELATFDNALSRTPGVTAYAFH